MLDLEWQISEWIGFFLLCAEPRSFLMLSIVE
jgi:hypothetical protein